MSLTEAKKPNLRPLPWHFGVEKLTHELDHAPQLWDQFPVRTESATSPHHGLSDIFVRYNARENFEGDRHRFNESHTSAWWAAADLLPSSRRLAFELMSLVDGEQLGMVLVTKIPPGVNCKPHADHGWHARFYDKYAIQVKSAPGQAFCFEGERLDARAGESYLFNNAQTHWVDNPTEHERITLIVCIRTRTTGVN